MFKKKHKKNILIEKVRLYRQDAFVRFLTPNVQTIRARLNTKGPLCYTRGKSRVKAVILQWKKGRWLIRHQWLMRQAGAVRPDELAEMGRGQRCFCRGYSCAWKIELISKHIYYAKAFKKNQPFTLIEWSYAALCGWLTDIDFIVWNVFLLLIYVRVLTIMSIKLVVIEPK